MDVSPNENEIFSSHTHVFKYLSILSYPKTLTFKYHSNLLILLYLESIKLRIFQTALKYLIMLLYGRD